MKARYFRRWQIVRAIVVAAIMAAALCVRMRIGRDWVFAGADSYGYMQLADEIHRDMRYALGPPPEPLYYGRPPGYPLFLSTLLVNDVPNWFRQSSVNWHRMQLAQSVLEVLALGLLVYALVRRVAAFGCAVIAVLLVLFWPATIVMSNMILAESLATILTIAVILLLVAAASARWRWFGVGALVGAAFLVRVDSILLVAPCVAGLAFVRSWRDRVALGAIALAGFALLVGPWAIRNTVRFGRPHLLVATLDLKSRPADIDGFRRWMATWARGAGELRQFAFCYVKPSCRLSTAEFPPGAFASSQEREQIGALLAQRNQVGPTPEQSRGFERLAAERRHRRPFHVLLVLPLEHAVELWLTPPKEIPERQDWRPWPTFFNPILRWFRALSWILFGGVLVALVVLLSLPRMRQLGVITGSAILVRTLALGYGYYPEPRYIFEVTPIALVIIAVAGATIWVEARRLRTKRSPVSADSLAEQLR